MRANNIIEDLTDCKEECCCNKIDHRLALAENANDEDGFEDEEDEEEDEWDQLVEDVKSDVLIRWRETAVKASCPTPGCVESDVACTDEQSEGRGEDQTDRYRCAVVKKLEADYCVEHEDPY